MRRLPLFALLALALAGGIAHAQTGGDGVFELRPLRDGTQGVFYVWPDPATVYAINVVPGQIVSPGRQLCLLKIVRKQAAPRSKAHLRAGFTYRVDAVHLSRGQTLDSASRKPLMVLTPLLLTHDSAMASGQSNLSIRGMLINLWHSTGIHELITQTQN